jgi:hypothetical protein
VPAFAGMTKKEAGTKRQIRTASNCTNKSAAASAERTRTVVGQGLPSPSEIGLGPHNGAPTNYQFAIFASYCDAGWLFGVSGVARERNISLQICCKSTKGRLREG